MLSAGWPLLRLMTTGVPTADSAAIRLRLRQHARGALLGLALGDALGATVEFMTPREIAATHGCHAQIRGGGWLRLAPGAVTDDTGMALALADAWLLNAHAPAAEDYARAFDAWMRSKPVDIGHTVRRALLRFRQTGQACVPPSDEAGNGATMRCAPLALVLLGAPPDTLATATLAQARVTHHNALTDAATLTVVNMVQAGLHAGGTPAGIRAVMAQAHLLAQRFPLFRFRTRPVMNPSAYIVDSLRVVLQAIDLHDSFEGALIEAVNRGGDADTTGAITGAIMGALLGEAALPERWLKALAPAVRQRCGEAADALVARSPAWRRA
ncbi:MAG: ADP-ribosylglycohydrolase family protein [Candidatus Dactylopiibacterium sp.]|nr:ADP-ribosylglycohydrolase family protein [Candidatus Dactylopiibacterium sp.]